MAIDVQERPAPEAPAPARRPFAPAPLGWVARAIVWGAIAWVVLVFPLGRPGFEVQQYAQAVIYGIIGLSLNVLLGYVGQISLGHQAFVGIGAFASAYMITEQGQSFWVGVLVAVAIGAGQALVLGGVSLRVTGLYFALVTLSYGLVAERNIFQIEELTGGGQGQPAPKPPAFDTDWQFYYLCVAFLALVLWIDWRMMRTKSGRALLALRENPRVAATFGVNVKLLILFAFVVSGAFAGLGGALLASNDTFVSPETWSFNLALIFVIMTVVGGLRSRAGVVIGSAFFALIGYLLDKFTFIQDALNAIPGAPDLTNEVAPLVIGPILLLITLIFFPGGIGQQIRPLVGWLCGGRFDWRNRGPKEVQITDVRA
jgi:branched-chain amino acid transport system permease protein